MTRMLAHVHQAWDGRKPREQRMLMLMALLVATTALWLGVVRPLNGWREDAAANRARAVAELTEARAALVRIAPDAGETRPVDARGLEPAVRQTAEAAGLQITTGMDPSGRLGFQVGNAPGPALFGWLAALETTHGLQPVSLGVVENADASLQVEGAF